MQHDKRELTYFQEQSLDYKIETANERIRAWYESWCRFDIYDEATGKSRFVTMDTRDNSVPDIKDSEFITGIRPGQVYIAFSGGADSTVLLDLVRKIYPDVEAVFCNTGLEYAPFFVKDYYDYYKTERGYTERSLNSNNGWNTTSALSFINMPILRYSNEIRSAVLIIHGEKAHSCYFSRDAYANMLKDNPYADNKELLIIPNAVHTDLYDDKNIIPFDKITDFYNKYLYA